MKKIKTFTKKIHSMVVVDNKIYVSDGKTLYCVEPQIDSVWIKILKWLGIRK